MTRTVSTRPWPAQTQSCATPFRAGIHRLELRSLDFSGPGISSARTPFELDPELAWGEADRFTEWGEAIGRRLCPLGEPDHGRFFLGTVEEGVLYLVETWIASFGPVPHAMENLVLGVAPRRIDEGYEPAGHPS
ncbi:SUKH-3 domain-containing protein [Streptomyces cellulosae]|uniref:SUKH-3 domain-containing protein n=1 Tax=Streptomyces cellulosae TaxID=1968 RepID=A0ABW6JQT8_STRCE